MANNKKVVQRGCAKRSLAKAKTHRKNKSVKQRGGDLHKMYNYNNLQVDPQRMITMDKGTVQTGGKGTDHKGTDHKGTDHKGTDYKGTDHKGTDYKGTDHKGTDHKGTDHKGTDHKGTDHKGTDHKGTLYKGKGGKHRHSRKYYKRGGALNFSAVENAVHQATTAQMFNNPLSIQTNRQVPAYI